MPRTFLLLVSISFVLSGESGFQPLFDGISLRGWKMVGQKGGGYLVKDGMLVSADDEIGVLFTEKEYSNFALRFEYRLTKAANNGIGVRAPLEGGLPSHTAMEIQILDDTAYQGDLKVAQNNGSIYGVAPAKEGVSREPGKWNREEIGASGSHITVTLNGHTIVDADLSAVADAGVLKLHPGILRPTGHIGLIAHRSRVDFRNIRVRNLP